MTVRGEAFDIDVRSCRIRVQRFGSPSAPLVVGLHGLSLNMKAFDFIGERLGDAVQIVAIDLRGRGRSPGTGPGTYGWENHARDVFALADALGAQEFGIIGQSMGGAIAMKAAELEPNRLSAVVLSDIAGRVDRGAGEAIAASMASMHAEYPSMDAYLDAVQRDGFVDEWNEYWDRCYRYGSVPAHDGIGVRAAVDAVALAEDRAYGATQGALYVYERWKHLTMPTLLLRATRELRPGIGHVVPADDCRAFLRDVRNGSVVEVDANHVTINTHPVTVAALRQFFEAPEAFTAHHRQ